MHRSGTSLVTSLLAGSGLDVGRRLIGPMHGNQRGHWEDLDFYEFHAKILGYNDLSPDGFTTLEALRLPSSVREEALSLVLARDAENRPWGWKDPRTTLLLDFWAELLPDLKFLLLFRCPWEVIDSLFRRGDPAFAANPSLAIQVWYNYNSRIHDFYLRNQSRCALVELSQVIVNYEAFADLAKIQFGLTLRSLQTQYDSSLLVLDNGIGRRELLQAFMPEAIDLYKNLQMSANQAGFSSIQVASPCRVDRISRQAIADYAISEWHRSAVAEAECAKMHQENASIFNHYSEAKERNDLLAIEIQKMLLSPNTESET